MATELHPQGIHPFTLTRYFGGFGKGTSIQVTGPNCNTTDNSPLAFSYIRMSRKEAIELAYDLLRFGYGDEVSDNDN